MTVDVHNLVPLLSLSAIARDEDFDVTTTTTTTTTTARIPMPASSAASAAGPAGTDRLKARSSLGLKVAWSGRPEISSVKLPRCL